MRALNSCFWSQPLTPTTHSPPTLGAMRWCLNENVGSCLRIYCVTVKCNEALNRPTLFQDVVTIAACFLIFTTLCLARNSVTLRARWWAGGSGDDPRKSASAQARDDDGNGDGNDDEDDEPGEGVCDDEEPGAKMIATPLARVESANGMKCATCAIGAVLAVLAVLVVFLLQTVDAYRNAALEVAMMETAREHDGWPGHGLRSFAPPAQAVLIPILGMMRSGTTELSAELSTSAPRNARLIDLGEIFNGGPSYNREGTPHRTRQLKDPVGFLRNELPPNTGAVWKQMNGHLPDAQLLTLLRDPAVCPIVVERNNITAQFCSWVHAGRTGDWTGHLSKTGIRTHIPCDLRLGEARYGLQGIGRGGSVRSNFAQFIAEHQHWYSWITHTLQAERIPYLYVTFDALTKRRSCTFAAIYNFCGLRTEKNWDCENASSLQSA